MRQSEFKRKYNHELGRYVKTDIYGEGIWDFVKSIGSKLLGKTSKEIMKRGIQKGAEKAVEKSTEKVGNFVANKAGDKIVSLSR